MSVKINDVSKDEPFVLDLNEIFTPGGIRLSGKDVGVEKRKKNDCSKNKNKKK